MKARSVSCVLAFVLVYAMVGCKATPEQRPVATDSQEQGLYVAAPRAEKPTGLKGMFASLFGHKETVVVEEEGVYANAPEAWKLLGLRRLWGIAPLGGEQTIQRAWLIDRYLFLENDLHYFYVYDRHTGEFVFGLNIGAPITNEPTYSAEDGMLYVVAGGFCYEIDLINRRAPRTLDLVFSASTGPAVDMLALYFGTDNHRLCKVDRKSSYYTDGRSVKNAIHSTPVMGTNTVYFGCNDGTVYGVERAGKMEISRRFETGGPVTAGVLLEEGLLYVCSQDYYIYAIPAIQPQAGKSDYLWKVSLESGTAETPASIGSRLYVRTESRGLFALNKYDNGTTQWHVPEGEKLLCVGKENAYVLLKGEPPRIVLVDSEEGIMKERMDVSGFSCFVTNPVDATIYLVGRQGRVLALREWEGEEPSPDAEVREAED